MPKIKTRHSTGGSWLRQRELGMRFPMGHGDRFCKTLYSSIQPVTSWGHGENLCNAMHGGVFNLEYSSDGSLLLAACEKKSILMFDPLCRRLIRAIDNAHNDCVNCVRFLDQRMFATCSDDSTVALWDARNLKQRIRTLKGHSNWVKNIEYSPRDGLLLTSGFDGSIYTWDINSFTENSYISNRVFHTNGLMRTRLSPDASKMLICTTSGYLIIIHNLDLSTLSRDLAGFKPNMYRLMQLSQTTIPVVANFTHLFSSSRTHNRVEFLTDFPVGDDAEVISSLQVHPQGWCALSRNVSTGEKSEWTCVHDIQERDQSAEEQSERSKESDESGLSDPLEAEYEVSQEAAGSRNITSSFVIDSANRVRIVQTMSDVRSSSAYGSEAPSRPTGNYWQEVRRINLRSHSQSPRADGRTNYFGDGVAEGTSREEDANAETESRIVNRPREASQQDYRLPTSRNAQMSDWRRRNMLENSNFSTANVELHVSSSDVWEALVAIREARLRREREREFYPNAERRNWLGRGGGGGAGAGSGNANNNFDSAAPIPVNLPRASHTVVIIGDRGRPQSQNRQAQNPMFALPRNHKIHQNICRLTHFIEEPNVGSGYIKELCFSADGRLICSPFGYGVRLLAFTDNCEELSDCMPKYNKSLQLAELATNISHSDIVVSTKFSPRHCLLVSGCLSGKIVWHQPVV